MTSEQMDKSDNFSFLYACYEYYHDLITENTLYINLQIPPWRCQVPTILRQFEVDKLNIDTTSYMFENNSIPPDILIYINYEVFQLIPKFVSNINHSKYFLYTLDYINWECNSRHKQSWEMFIDKTKKNEAGIRSTCQLVPNVLTNTIVGFLEHLNEQDTIGAYENYNSLFKFNTIGNNYKYNLLTNKILSF
jgi:hypothetical protein